MAFALEQTFRNYLQRNPLIREIFSFCVVGGIGFCTDLGIFVSAQMIMPDVPARGCGLVLATLLVWWLNRQFTFRSADPKIGREIARFFMSRIGGIAINGGVSLFILREWPHVGSAVAVAAGTIVSLGVNYMTSKHWVFKKLVPHTPVI